MLLEGQIEAQLRMLDSLLESDGVPVVVVGHSIGAYMGARLGAARAVVGGTYGLFPALAHVGRAPNAARIQLLLRQRWVVTLALLLLRVLPVYAMLRGTTAAFVRRGASVHAALDLAQNEFDTVHALRDDMLRGHNTRLLWGSRDGWAPDWVRTQISHARSAVKSELDTTGLPHAFCLGEPPPPHTHTHKRADTDPVPVRVRVQSTAKRSQRSWLGGCTPTFSGQTRRDVGQEIDALIDSLEPPLALCVWVWVWVPVEDDLGEDEGIKDGGEGKAPEEEGVVGFSGGGEDARDGAEELGDDDERAELASAPGGVELEDLGDLGRERDGDRGGLEEREHAVGDEGESECARGHECGRGVHGASASTSRSRGVGDNQQRNHHICRHPRAPAGCQ